MANCNYQAECFAFTVDTRLDGTGATTGVGATFAIPLSGRVSNTNNTYSWAINWGDGTNIETPVSGTGSTTSVGIPHTYAAGGQYQITIRPSGTATTGWLNAFGFYENTDGANADANKYMLLSIDTPLTNLMRTQGSAGASYRFAYMFYGAVNAIGIPDNLFANISTIGVTSFSNMFRSTFYNFAYNSTEAAIPANLFSSFDASKVTNFSRTFSDTFYNFAYNSTNTTIPSDLFIPIDTSSGTNFSHMFDGVFRSFANQSTIGIIPDDLFSTINTSKGTDFSYMFYYAFDSYAFNSTVGTIPAGLFRAIDTRGSLGDFSYMFNHTFDSFAYNSIAANIPAGLFSTIDTSGGTNFLYMFSNTFFQYAYSSTVSTIPVGLFDAIKTSNGAEFAYMFNNTFNYCAYSSTIGNIPTGLFDAINTSGGANLSHIFSDTFGHYAYSSTIGTIPNGLFDAMSTSINTDFSYMFYHTFDSFAANSTAGTIPADLFGTIDTANGTTFTNMFSSVFANFARRTASFVINGSVADVQTFPGIAVSGVYSTKIGATGTPTTNPSITADNHIYPTYNSTTRTITAPNGTFAGYTWYRTDGTSCAVANPTPSCGPQNMPVAFPNSTEWTPATSTEKGSVVFYAPLVNYIDLSLSSGTVNIDGLTPSQDFNSNNNTATVATNNSTGYTLSISTDLPSSDLHALDMKHEILGEYIVGTGNSCSWDDESENLINTESVLAVNTWGFTLDSENLAAQKLCRVPDNSSPLIIKATSSADEAGDETTINFGVKINAVKPAGTYSATVVYTAIANP